METNIAMTITARQIRAARALIGWDRQECADRCGIGIATLARVEREVAVQGRTMVDIVRAFSDAGVLFFDDERGHGVAIRASSD